MADTPTLVFVHGALVRDADWWWQAMREPLAARGIPTAVVKLSSCGEAGALRGDLHDDIAAARQTIAETTGPVVLLGHSYGGMVISGAGTDERVTQLVYVSSVMPEAGQAQGEIASDEPAPWVVLGDDGSVSADPELIRELFLQDCDPETTSHALERLTPQTAAVFGQSSDHAAWEDTPATYIVCTEDLAFPSEVQRRRIRGGAETIEFAAGHHPFLSRPDAFADCLAEAIHRPS